MSDSEHDSQNNSQNPIDCLTLNSTDLINYITINSNDGDIIKMVYAIMVVFNKNKNKDNDIILINLLETLVSTHNVDIFDIIDFENKTYQNKKSYHSNIACCMPIVGHEKYIKLFNIDVDKFIEMTKLCNGKISLEYDKVFRSYSHGYYGDKFKIIYDIFIKDKNESPETVFEKLYLSGNIQFDFIYEILRNMILTTKQNINFIRIILENGNEKFGNYSSIITLIESMYNKTIKHENAQIKYYGELMFFTIKMACTGRFKTITDDAILKAVMFLRLNDYKFTLQDVNVIIKYIHKYKN